ncbi:MAG: hypothetical protein HC769_09980 [Cyanobacteria bacterium CRU_2_1]|nr:hypothetical protein [Cyanobacteria bacterium RU_5_0]NJR59140.1 hypothetical protein [Cyanobacteria bacterium CRU_2_1]
MHPLPFLPLSYHDRLHPWCIIRLLPKMQRTVIARFRKRNDAEAHLKLLQQMNPEAKYAIVFDPSDHKGYIHG